MNDNERYEEELNSYELRQPILERIKKVESLLRAIKTCNPVTTPAIYWNDKSQESPYQSLVFVNMGDEDHEGEIIALIKEKLEITLRRLKDQFCGLI